MSKYEIVEINGRSLSVDISMIMKTESVFFNATAIAKNYGKRPDDFWKQDQNKKYLKALVTLSQGNEEDFVITKRGGKHQGTWFHNELALQFARWLDPFFAVALDRWIKQKFEETHDWKDQRLAARTGYRPLTDAIFNAHEDPKPYHFSNRADMINRIVLGMTAKKYKELHQIDSVREHVTAEQLAMIELLQRMLASFIEADMDNDTCKAHLQARFDKGLPKYLQSEEAA